VNQGRMSMGKMGVAEAELWKQLHASSYGWAGGVEGGDGISAHVGCTAKYKQRNGLVSAWNPTLPHPLWRIVCKDVRSPPHPNCVPTPEMDKTPTRTMTASPPRKVLRVLTEFIAGVHTRCQLGNCGRHGGRGCGGRCRDDGEGREDQAAHQGQKVGPFPPDTHECNCVLGRQHCIILHGFFPLKDVPLKMNPPTYSVSSRSRTHLSQTSERSGRKQDEIH